MQGGGQGWPDRHLYADGQVTMYMNNNYLSGGNSLLLSKKVSICGSEEQEMVDTDENENPGQKESDSRELEVVDITEDPSMDGSKSAGQKQGRGKPRLGQRGGTYYKIIQ